MWKYVHQQFTEDHLTAHCTVFLLNMIRYRARQKKRTNRTTINVHTQTRTLGLEKQD